MRYVALFRGLNVGGRNIVKMAELKAMLTELGLEDVRTYIQSGNALFSSGEGEAALSLAIERAFTDRFGFHSGVALRAQDELAAIVSGVPFSLEEIVAAEKAAAGAEALYCYLLAETAPRAEIEMLCASYTGRDRLVASGREIYLLCRQSIRDSKPAMSLQKLALPMTSRNLKTLRKLYELMIA